MPSHPPNLSGEQHVGAADLRLSEETEKVKRSPAARSEEGPRKRAKKRPKPIVTEPVEEESEDGEDAGVDEQSKKARGRPRLDTTDQNAAERRRTQIRLAQRAYRNRKENALQTLENEVRVLQEAKEEMSNAFMKLHDFAISQGVLEKIPAFAQELQSTTERILMLAKKTSESGGENSRAPSVGKDTGPSEKSLGKQPEKTTSPDAVRAPPMTTGSSVWGYTFDEETTQIEPTLAMPDVSTPTAAQIALTKAPLGYGITSMSTFDNASFPADLHTHGSFPPQGAVRSAQQQNATPIITTPTFSPSNSLPTPLTLAYVEATFGRRLQRSSLELAYRLSSMPNPPNDILARIFGFCLHYESVEQIRERVHKCLEKTREESLNDWRAPFWALGGIGQHQMGAQQQDKPVGNQGTADVAKHAFGTSFAMGPFNTATTEVRDQHLDATMRITLPGFQGDFFEPDEVELYLQSHGVCIQPGQDYVTAEVDVMWLEDLQQQQSNDSHRQWAPGMPPPMGKTSETTMMAAEDGSWMGGRALAVTQPTTNSMGHSNDAKISFANQKEIVTLNVDVFIGGEFDCLYSSSRSGKY
ncbi:hypothetical protein N0V82_008803 [Gnomoniopsis sp. IMI 355080]|nr:hypothetical protein N0V82_008803 [Gnomoniopsis sp. IMI 355080]